MRSVTCRSSPAPARRQTIRPRSPSRKANTSTDFCLDADPYNFADDTWKGESTCCCAGHKIYGRFIMVIYGPPAQYGNEMRMGVV